MNLRERVERDLARSLEGRWGLPVELIAPDGTKQTGLLGQVLYDIVRLNPETGEDVIINMPVVTLRRSSLDRVPVAGETWVIRIPVEPRTDADLQSYVMSSDRPPEGGRSLGIIRLYCQTLEQTVAQGNFNEEDIPFNINDWAFNEQS